jgi:hypothetical protein
MHIWARWVSRHVVIRMMEKIHSLWKRRNKLSLIVVTYRTIEDE